MSLIPNIIIKVACLCRTMCIISALKASVEPWKFNLTWESLISFLILWASIEIHRDHYRPGALFHFRIRASRRETLAWCRAILLSWEHLCHMSGLVRRWGGPCYWKAHLSRSPHSLLPSDYLISRRGKCPISVIFYFVMKVSRGCEKEEMHRKSLPWENSLACTRVCAGPTARWVDVLFTLCVHLSAFWCGRSRSFNWQVCLCIFSAFN